MTKELSITTYLAMLLVIVCLDVQGQSHPTWTHVTLLTVSGQTLTKTNSQSGWNAAAISEEYTYGDGWIEFSVLSAKYTIMGLSNYNTDVGPTFNYGIYTHINGFLYVRENGVALSAIGKYGSIRVQFTAADVLRVERTGTVIRYKKNGITFYTSTLPSTGPIYADCSFGLYQAAITVRNFDLGVTWTGAIDEDWNKPGNWSANRVPASLDHVNIGNCSTCPAISDNVTIGSLRMGAGSNLHIGGYTLTVGNATVLTEAEIKGEHGTINSKDFTDIKNSTITGAITLQKNGGVANVWYGGNNFSPEVNFVNKSNRTLKLSSQSNNEIIKPQ